MLVKALWYKELRQLRRQRADLRRESGLVVVLRGHDPDPSPPASDWMMET